RGGGTRLGNAPGTLRVCGPVCWGGAIEPWSSAPRSEGADSSLGLSATRGGEPGHDARYAVSVATALQPQRRSGGVSPTVSDECQTWEQLASRRSIAEATFPLFELSCARSGREQGTSPAIGLSAARTAVLMT